MTVTHDELGEVLDWLSENVRGHRRAATAGTGNTAWVAHGAAEAYDETYDKLYEIWRDDDRSANNEHSSLGPLSD